jgi:hypothetical protein
MAEVPPLPPGFTLDQQTPPLPPGFTLDGRESGVSQKPTALNRSGAFAAGFNRGVAFLAGIPVDTVTSGMDLLGMGYGMARSLISGKPPDEYYEPYDRSNVIGSGEYFANLLDKGTTALTGEPVTKIPRPDDAASRYLYAAGTGAPSAVLTPGNTAMAASSGITGGLASQFAAEQGASPGVQAFAGMAGSMAPSAIRYGVAQGARQLARGGEEGRRRVEENIKAFEDSGTQPSVGQASASRLARATESFLSRTPGAAGRMSAVAEKQASQMGDRIERMAVELSSNRASGEQAGRAIQRGISGDNGFVSNFKKTQQSLYDALDDHISKDTRVDVSNTQAALKNLNQDIPGAPNVSEFFKNAKIKGIEAALKADTDGPSALTSRPDIPEFADVRASKSSASKPSDPFRQTPNQNPFGPATREDLDLAADLLNDGKLPYEALKKLRTLVGGEMADSGIMSDVPRSKWKSLYAALSSDLENAAKASGKEATAAFNRANNYTRAGMRRIEVLDSVVDKNGGPERVFQAAISGAKEGATTLRAVMQSLPKDAQKTLTASVLRRLGRAKAGQQNDLGERFSTETFLTNWNSMSPEAKAVLFDRHSPGFRADMNAIAKVASNLRDGSAVWRNPSGTGQAAAQTGAVVAFVTSLASGNVKLAAGIAGGAAGANLSARILTNPTAVRWLAKTTRAPQSALPALVAEAARSSDPDLRELAALLKEQPNE